MANVSAADMFASKGCEHACSNIQEKPTKTKNATASLIGSAIAAGSVILATQLRAEAQEAEQETSELELSNLSPDVMVGKTLPTPASFNIDTILGSVIEGDSTNIEVATLGNPPLANTNTINNAGEVTQFPSENGFPNGAITEAFGVSDPSQTTNEIGNTPQQDNVPETIPAKTAGGNIILAGENGSDGADGTNGRDGINGENGLNGRDGLDGTDGQDGTNGQDGVDGQNGTDGQDGLSVFVIDPATLENPETIPALNALGITVNQGPAGFGYVTADASQIASIAPLLEQIALEQIIAIEGTPDNDVLQGNNRDNIIDGQAGDDILIGGAGADTLNGGSGVDTADYSSSAEGIEINLGQNTARGGDSEGDLLQEIENISGSHFFDTLSGDNGANALFGNDGDDTLFGDAGNDRLQGGQGADVIDGGAGIDLADYSTSSAGVNISLLFDTAEDGDAEGDELDNIENLNGSRFFDTLEGDNQNNRLGGLSGDDELFGEGGNDTLLGGSGADFLDGGDGIDTSDYTASSEGVLVNLETGEARFGQAEGDEFFSIENLAGSAFDDTLTGDAGANRITGRAGNDILFGNEGNDTLIGSEGDDILNGGAGNDVFSFGDETGADIIQDFEAGLGRTDRVDLRSLDNTLFDDFDDIQSALTDTQDGAVLSFTDGEVLFENVQVSEFVADDFILA